MFFQVVNEEVESIEKSIESHNSQITRSLLLDFSDKSEVIYSFSEKEEEDCSSELTAAAEEEDSASAWSVQVNASSTHDEEEEVEFEEEDGEWSAVDELCLGIENMGIKGKHTRFLYNSDDEMVAEEGVLKLKGLPTPKGKHIRFGEKLKEDRSTNSN